MAVEMVDQIEEQAAAVGTESGDNPAEDAQPEQLVVTIGDDQQKEEPPEEELRAAPAWVKEVRKTNRELEKKARELERQLREERQRINAQAQPQELSLGPKPDMNDKDVDYDVDKLAAKMEIWLEQKRTIESHKAAAEAEARKEAELWQAKRAAYQEKKAALGADDYQESEEVVISLLNNVQQNIIVDVANDPALVVYALGKNEAKAKELAAIKNPIHFGIAVAKLEETVKVGKRPALQPEKRVSGNAGISGVTDSTLERLRAEAEKTGDMSKVIAYKNQHKAKN